MSTPRPASEAPFPYASRHVCYFVVRANGQPHAVSGKSDLRAVAASGEELFAVWPGQWRSDLFVIDRPELLLAALRPVGAA